MSGQPLLPRREDPDAPYLAVRVECPCGASLRRVASRRRGYCPACWTGQISERPLEPVAKQKRRSDAKAPEPWTLERVREILRIVEATPIYADLGAVCGIPYQQLTARAGTALGASYVVADSALVDALVRLREVMMERARLRRGKVFNRPMRTRTGAIKGTAP